MDKTETRSPDLTLRDSAFYAGFLSIDDGRYIRFDAIEAVIPHADGSVYIDLSNTGMYITMPIEKIMARIEDYSYWRR